MAKLTSEEYEKRYNEYKSECSEIAAECEEEFGYAHGSNYELRCDQLADSEYYWPLFHEDDDEEEEENTMKNLTDNEETAIRKAFEACDVYGLYEEDIQSYMEDGTATINEARNGRAVAWVIWSETKQAAVEVGTLRKLTEEEIESELC